MKRALPIVLAGTALTAVAVAQVPEEPAEPERAVVWAVGDGANGTAASRRLARRIAAGDPDRFLYLGDVYDRGTAREFRRNYEPVYGRLAEITEPTTGNHEWANRRAGYYPWWKRKKGRRQAPWYRFEIAGWEVLALSSEAAHGSRSPQVRWLRRAVRAPGTCRIAFFHRPRYSAGSLHGDAPDMRPVWSALRGNARLVLGAHEHNSQRFRRRDGLTQYVAGAGGPNLYPLRRDRRVAFARNDTMAALRLVLRPGRALAEFRDERGRVLDRSRARCRPVS